VRRPDAAAHGRQLRLQRSPCPQVRNAGIGSRATIVIERPTGGSADIPSEHAGPAERSNVAAASSSGGCTWIDCVSDRAGAPPNGAGGLRDGILALGLAWRGLPVASEEVFDALHAVFGLGHWGEDRHEFCHGRGEAVDRIGQRRELSRKAFEHLDVLIDRLCCSLDRVGGGKDLTLGPGDRRHNVVFGQTEG
jgi:hypothetical protein